LPRFRDPQSLPPPNADADDPADFACRRRPAQDDFEAMTHFQRLALAAVLLSGCLISTAAAGPPSYLLLRDAEAPGPHLQPAYPAAIHYDARTRGYAYGYFGVKPRTHASRHFGIYRDYTQWSRW
jgi:hypothetical protein